MNKLSIKELCLSYREGCFTINEVYVYLMYNSYKIEDLSCYLSDKEYNELQEKINIIEDEIKKSILSKLSNNLEDVIFLNSNGFQFTIKKEHYIK